MYYWVDIMSGGLRELKCSDLEFAIIVKSPSEKAFWKVAEKVEGDCARNTYANEIKMGVEREFLIADPIKFRGTPVGKYKSPYGGSSYLEIKITKDIFVYSYIDGSGICSFLEPLQ